MKLSVSLAIVAMLALQPASGQDVPKLPCAEADKKCAAEAMKNHVAGRIDTWRAALSMPFNDRIGPAPSQLVEYINLDNIQNGFPERPRATRLDANLLADVKGAIAGLPPEVWSFLASASSARILSRTSAEQATPSMYSTRMPNPLPPTLSLTPPFSARKKPTHR